MAANDIRSKIIALASEHEDIEVLWLYGSRARGTETTESDWDLAVAFKEFEREDWTRRLKPELLAMEWREAVGGGIAVSIADINQVSSPLAYSIIQDNTVWYCSNSLRLHKEEQRIWSMWEEYRYEHEKHWA